MSADAKTELTNSEDDEEEEEEDNAKQADGEGQDEEREVDAELKEKPEGEEGEGEGGDDAESDEDAPRKPAKKSAKNDSLELPEYSPDELADVDKDMLTGEITALEEEIAKAKPNLNVLHEYRRREAEFLDRARDLEGVTSQRDAAKQRYDDLRKVRLDEFMAGFNAISAKLKEMYQVS